MAREGVETIGPMSREEWHAWLERNHAASPPVFLTLTKKGSKLPGVRYEEAM